MRRCSVHDLHIRARYRCPATRSGNHGGERIWGSTCMAAWIIAAHNERLVHPLCSLTSRSLLSLVTVIICLGAGLEQSLLLNQCSSWTEDLVVFTLLLYERTRIVILIMFLRPGFVVVIVGATLTSLSTVVVALRYYCRYFLMRSVGASDHLMFVALVLTWGNFVVNYYQDETSRKFRPSFLRMPEKRPKIEAALRGNLITWWVYRMSYVAALCFVKLSILWFYRAIASHRTFRRYVNATIAFVCMYSFAAVMASAFQCENPSNSWSTAGYLAQFDGDRNTKRPKVKCFDPIKLWVFSAAANLLSDVVIMLLPIPALLSLRVPMSKRLALIGIFSIGIMAIIASSVRMWVMFLWAESPWNSARYGSDLLLWGQVETNSGIISASVPFLRMLFVSRKKEERGVTQRKVEASPPRPMGDGAAGSQHQALEKSLEVDTWALFEKDKEKGADDGEAGWQPFITVPESFHSQSGSRGSTLLEPTQHPHMTV